MYRALVTVRPADGSAPLGRTRLYREAQHLRSKARAAGAQAWFGTRHGDPGLWIVSSTKAGFRYALWQTDLLAEQTGYRLTALCTNAPSLDAASYLRPELSVCRG